MNARLVIGAEGISSLDWLAPIIYQHHHLNSDVIYFNDSDTARYSDQATVAKNLDGLLGFDEDHQSKGGLFAHSDDFGGTLKSLVTTPPPQLVERFLLKHAPETGFFEQRELPTLRDVCRGLTSHVLPAGDPIRLKLRGSRSRITPHSGIDSLATHIIFDKEGAASLEFGEGISGDTRLHCGGDYAILKSLAHGTPGYVPWYQPRAQRKDGRYFEALSPFEPLYSRRLVRRTAIQAALSGHLQTFGFLWHFDLAIQRPHLAEVLSDLFPCAISQAFCDMIVNPTRAPSVRVREAIATIDGALVSPNFSMSHLSKLVLSKFTPLKHPIERTVFSTLLLLSMGREARRIIHATNESDRKSANLVEIFSVLSNLGLERLLKSDIIGCAEAHMQILEELVASEHFPRPIRTLSALTASERELKSIAACQLVTLWDWADRRFRWSAARNFAIGLCPAPVERFWTSFCFPRRYWVSASAAAVTEAQYV